LSAKLTINNKVQTVALIGVLGFIIYFSLSIKSNIDYRNLFIDISQTDLEILELNNEINLMLNNIEAITQASPSVFSIEQAKQLRRKIQGAYQKLQNLDSKSADSLDLMSDLSFQYTQLLIDLSSGQFDKNEERKKLSIIKELSKDIAKQRDEYRAFRYKQIEEKISKSQRISENSLRYGFIVGLMLTLFMLLLARYFAKGVTKTLSYLSYIAGKISQGDWHVEIRSDTNDETAAVLDAMEKMRSTLKNRADQDAIRDEEQTRMVSINKVSRGDLSVQELCQGIMSRVTPMLGAQVGALYVSEDNTLKLIASYAFVLRKAISDRFELGEGIIGQVALEKTQVMLSDVPKDYLSITSSLGESRPAFVVITPLMFNEHLIGVFELGFVKEPSKHDLLFLMHAGESIAQFVESARARENINAMLSKTQDQATKLEQQQEVLQNANEDLEEQAMALTESEGRLLAQQEELRVSNEELEEQAKALKISEERLQTQQEELRVTNEELEEHTRALESQKLDMQQKNTELERSKKDLELSGQYKSEFMSTMSHELRTPLNSILILSENLSDNEGKHLTDKQVEHAKVIKKAGGDLLELINEILDLAKVEEGKLELIIDEIEFDEWLKDMDQLFTPVSEKKGIEFTSSIDKALGETFTSDSKRVNQIIKNLLSNALKFTERGSVSLQVSSVPADVKLTSCMVPNDQLIAFAVQDTGLGIESEKQSLIFEAFQQSDGAISRKYGGTGLGLTISNRLAKLLGGEITVFSEGEGLGSCFTLFIPKVALENIFSEDASLELFNQSSKADNALSDTKAEKISDNKIKQRQRSQSLLIVEDDPVFAETLTNLAKEYGLEVVTAADGKSGLALAKELLPQGIILDVMLPEMGGFEVMEALQADPDTKEIPVHFMSGNEEEDRALLVGAVDFLRKPASKSDIYEVFESIKKSKELKRLLIVESAKDGSFELVKSMIEEQGAEVISAKSLKEAINLEKGQASDCIIFDLDLLKMVKNTVELVSALETVRVAGGNKDVPLIVYTSQELDREQEGALRKYADRVILKSGPYSERLISEASLFLHWLGNEVEPNKATNAVARDALFEGKRVLIVDDDMRNVYSLTSELERRGMVVEAAGTGLECLDMLRQDNFHIDIVLMDIMMPELDGFSTIEQMRSDEQFQELPIIVLTAKSLKEDRDRCMKLGANDYLLKPIEVDRLLSLMRVWMT
jgi:CheY-like chemotaxis protein/HAMP domain-containing protein